jgi:flavin-dependent trigonelline monooxygenase, oxygenase component
MIEPLPRTQTVEELGQNLVICPPAAMVERLHGYAEAGIDELILSSNFGQPVEETLEMMERFAAEVMPHLRA